MEMTIDESKKRLVIEKELAIKTGLNHDANGTLADAIDVAVDTMNKYQKIEQLVKFYKNAGEIPIFVLEGVLNEVKDGND